MAYYKSVFTLINCLSIDKRTRSHDHDAKWLILDLRLDRKASTYITPNHTELNFSDDYLPDGDSAATCVSPASKSSTSSVQLVQLHIGTHSYSSDDGIDSSWSTTPTLPSTSLSPSPEEWEMESPLHSACNSPPHLKMLSPFSPGELEDYEAHLLPPVVMFSIDAMAANVVELQPNLVSHPHLPAVSLSNVDSSFRNPTLILKRPSAPITSPGLTSHAYSVTSSVCNTLTHWFPSSVGPLVSENRS